MLAALQAALVEIDTDRQDRLSHPASPADTRPAGTGLAGTGLAGTAPAETAAAGTADAVGALLRRVAGVSGKQPTDVEVISPLLLPEATDLRRRRLRHRRQPERPRPADRRQLQHRRPEHQLHPRRESPDRRQLRRPGPSTDSARSWA